MFDLFISTALAQGSAPQGPPPGQGSQFFMMVIIMIAIFYFLIFRPQAKQARDHQNLVSSLKKGDQVVTNAGIHGKVFAVEEDILHVEVAKGVRIRLDKGKVARKVGDSSVGNTGSDED